MRYTGNVANFPSFRIRIHTQFFKEVGSEPVLRIRDVLSRIPDPDPGGKKNTGSRIRQKFE
jgi:hypothetical protein